jgi:hypothetical protein
MPKQTKTKILKRELADLLNCLPIVISRLVKKGEIKTEIDGKIDISSPSMQKYIEDKRLEIQKHKERTAKRELKAIDDKLLNVEGGMLNVKQGVAARQIDDANLTSNTQPSTLNNLSFHILELETKKHKLESEKYKAQLLEMEAKRRRKELINLELLNRIISKTIGNLTKNIIEIPLQIVDEIIDMAKTEEEPKTQIINLITKALYKEVESTVSKTEKEIKRIKNQ